MTGAQIVFGPLLFVGGFCYLISAFSKGDSLPIETLFRYTILGVLGIMAGVIASTVGILSVMSA